MDLDLTAVESFTAVTEQRHFGRAAELLGVSVSALTKRIQRLEAALGVPLIERDSGGFTGLTPAGQRFVQFAPQLLHAAYAAKLVATNDAVTILRLAVPAGVGVVAPLLPAALDTLELALRHAHPGVSIESVPTAFPNLTRDLLDGKVDVVLTFGASARPEISSTRLSEIHRVGLVSATHPLAFRRTVGVDEFARLPLLYSPGLPDEYMHPFVLADVRPPSEATLVPIDASNTAHVAQRILQGREDKSAPLSLDDPDLLAGQVAISFGVPLVLVVLLGTLAFTQEFRLRHGHVDVPGRAAPHPRPRRQVAVAGPGQRRHHRGDACPFGDLRHRADPLP